MTASWQRRRWARGSPSWIRTASKISRVAQGTKVIGSVTWAADGSFLLASSPSGATVWAVDGWEAVRSLESGSGSMLPVALSPDGSRIALGWDNHVGLWSADEAVARRDDRGPAEGRLRPLVLA